MSWQEQVTLRELMQRRNKRQTHWTWPRVRKIGAFLFMLVLGSLLTTSIAWSYIWGEGHYLVSFSIVWFVWLATLLYVKW